MTSPSLAALRLTLGDAGIPVGIAVEILTVLEHLMTRTDGLKRLVARPA